MCKYVKICTKANKGPVNFCTLASMAKDVARYTSFFLHALIDVMLVCHHDYFFTGICFLVLIC